MARARTKTKDLQSTDGTCGDKSGARGLAVTVTSFGYKAGAPPVSNVLFDVRFLKNPYWVPELRPLTGLDAPVKEYVLQQSAAIEFLDSVLDLLVKVLPRFEELDISEFSIALGCTGGQHRSTALVEELAGRLQAEFPHFEIKRLHRELGEVQQ
jgi:UPF0042 nucleotide-binding protein